MFRAIKRSFTEAIRGMIKNGLMTVTSLFVVSACIFVFGVFLMLILNINFMTDEMADSYEVNVYIERSVQIEDDTVSVFINRDTAADEETYQATVNSIQTQIIGVENVDVSNIVFVSEADVIAGFKNSLGESAISTYTEIQPGFVGDCFRIKLNDYVKAEETFEIIGAIENVASVMKADEVYQRLALLGNVSTDFNDTKYQEVKEKLKNDILAIDNISPESLEFVKGEDIVKEFKKDLTDDELKIFEGLPDDFMHDAYNVRLKDLSRADETIEQLKALENVDTVENTRELVEIIENLKNSVQTVSIWVIVVFAIVSLFIISNTIKLTVHNRRKEINIMKYVGATDSYIRGPFIMEGIMVGLVSAVLAFFISMWSYQGLVSAIIANGSSMAFAFDIMDFSLMWKDLAIAYVCVGVLIGAFGSFISVRRYLHV
ncbi:MAG: permease-like cell division protein FtsX [Clostridia bacterium]|nr:permease-like cell division protein FtsX [Clostridia bacterium]